MELALTLGLAGLVGLVIFWVWRSAGNAANAEAFKANAAAANDRASGLNDAMVAEAEAQAKEDRLRADEIVRARDADGARKLLLDATGRKPN